MQILIITLFTGFLYHLLAEKRIVTFRGKPVFTCFMCFSFWVSLACMFFMYHNNNWGQVVYNVLKAGSCTYLGMLINQWRSNY